MLKITNHILNLIPLIRFWKSGINFGYFLHRSNFQATPPPILIDNGIAVLENEVIERHIMKNIPGGHNLFVQDQGVSKLIENVYSKVRNLNL